MKKIIITLLTAGACTLAPLLSTAPAFAAARPTVAYGVPYGHNGGNNFVDGRVAPRGLLVWTGDGSAWFSHMRWQSWRRYSARGTAVVHVRSCYGSCFRYKTEHTALRFYRVRTHSGQRYFTRLHFYLRRKVAGLGSGTLHFSRLGNPAWYPG